MPFGMKKFVDRLTNSNKIDIDSNDPKHRSSASRSSSRGSRDKVSLFSKRSKSKSTSKNLNDTEIKLKDLEKVLKELECPVCFNTCVPPIIPCINGHLLCSTCRKNIHLCPTCREGFSTTRNTFAENFFEEYSQACRYAEEGCTFFKWKGDDMKSHEAQCFYRNVKCPIPDCGCSVGFNGVLGHLVDVHNLYGANRLPVLVTYFSEGPISSNKKWLPYYIEAYGCIFYVMMEIVRPHFWIWISVQYPNEEQSQNETYHGTITLINKDKNISTQWKGPVYNIRTPQNTILQEGLSFGSSEVLVKHFEKNGLISVHINIKKRVKSDPTTTTITAFPNPINHRNRTTMCKSVQSIPATSKFNSSQNSI